jgi:hypothetical protein
VFPGLEEPAHYITALLVLDAAIAKAKGADPRDPFARAMDIEGRLAKVLTGTFYKRARKATVWAVDQVASSPFELDERAAFHIAHGIAPFFDDWDVEVADTVQACTSEAYKLGKEVGYTQAFNPHLKETPPKASQLHGLVEKAVPKGAKFLEVKPNFTQKDEAAIDAIKSHQVFWIGKFYDDKLSDRIASASSSVLLGQGLSQSRGCEVPSGRADQGVRIRPGRAQGPADQHRRVHPEHLARLDAPVPRRPGRERRHRRAQPRPDRRVSRDRRQPLRDRQPEGREDLPRLRRYGGEEVSKSPRQDHAGDRGQRRLLAGADQGLPSLGAQPEGPGQARRRRREAGPHVGGGVEEARRQRLRVRPVPLQVPLLDGRVRKLGAGIRAGAGEARAAASSSSLPAPR